LNNVPVNPINYFKSVEKRKIELGAEKEKLSEGEK